MPKTERESLADRLKAWNRQNYTQLIQNGWDRGGEGFIWRGGMSDLAKKLGDNGIPLANLMPYLERCEENRPDFNYGLDEVNELLYSIRQLITDQNDVGGELSWRHHEGDLAFNLQDAKAAAAKAKALLVEKAAKAKIYTQNKVAEAKKYAHGARKYVDDRLTHREEDLAQADMRGKLTTALFQPPPGWPWG